MLVRFELASEGGATATFTHRTTPAKFLTGKDAHQRVWTLLRTNLSFCWGCRTDEVAVALNDYALFDKID